MCPRYCQTSQYSKNSELFSFGTLLLEIVTGMLQVRANKGQIWAKRRVGMG